VVYSTSNCVRVCDEKSIQVRKNQKRKGENDNDGSIWNVKRKKKQLGPVLDLGHETLVSHSGLFMPALWRSGCINNTITGFYDLWSTN
jgi:hypothetical protein